MKKTAIVTVTLCAVSLFNMYAATAQTMVATNATEKELYIPSKIYRIPDNNDYNNDTSAYSNKRSVQSANIAIFWHKEFGEDPTPIQTRKSGLTCMKR